MSFSRRLFLRMASVAAIATGFAARPTVVAFAQDLGAQAGPDPLAYYTQSTFKQYVNSIFRLHGSTTVDVALVKVEDTLPVKVSRARGRESFLLLFRGGSAQLPQDTYTVEHPALGTFKLFLVPSGADENGAQGYVATFNRLEYAAKPVGPVKPATRKTLQNPTRETKSPGNGVTTPDPKTSEPFDGVVPRVQFRRANTVSELDN